VYRYAALDYVRCLPGFEPQRDPSNAVTLDLRASFAFGASKLQEIPRPPSVVTRGKYKGPIRLDVLQLRVPATVDLPHELAEFCDIYTLYGGVPLEDVNGRVIECGWLIA
jgi:hypothetical protein